MINRPQATASILLVILVEITIAALAWELVVRRRRSGSIRKLANEWGMRFSIEDAYGLANRLVDHMPTPGSARVRADDLIYQWENDEFVCLFTMSYTLGATGGKRRKYCVAGVKQRGNENAWVVGPEGGRMLEQYQVQKDKLLEKKEPGAL